MSKSINIIIVLMILALFYVTYRLRSFKIEVKDNRNIDIVKKEITFDSQRKLLTAIYREKHTGDCNYLKDGIDYCVNIEPKLVVLHMAGLGSLEEVYNYLKEPVLRNERTALEKRSYDRLNVSAHFLIDRDGVIYSLMPEHFMARHAMGLNHISIGVENVGFNGQATKEQIVSNAKLYIYLKDKYNIEKLISHGEIGDLIDSEYYVEKIDNYYREKTCGNTLVKDVRNLIYSKE